MVAWNHLEKPDPLAQLQQGRTRPEPAPVEVELIECAFCFRRIHPSWEACPECNTVVEQWLAEDAPTWTTPADVQPPATVAVVAHCHVCDAPMTQAEIVYTRYTLRCVDCAEKELRNAR